MELLELLQTNRMGVVGNAGKGWVAGGVCVGGGKG